MTSVHGTVAIGRDQMHTLDFVPESAGLRIYFTWHNSIHVRFVNFAELENWARGARSEDFVQAEAQFIAATGNVPKLTGP